MSLAVPPSFSTPAKKGDNKDGCLSFLHPTLPQLAFVCNAFLTYFFLSVGRYVFPTYCNVNTSA